ncbi:MAG: hypothetical protein ACI4FV_04190 [Lachnospiraceae bacterium]
MRSKTKRMQKRLVKLILGITILFLVAGGALSVRSQSSDEITVDDASYHQMEKEYLEEVKQLLGEEGFENSGVTLTKEYKEDGTRDYQLLIHHKGIRRLSEPERQKLQEELSGISFPVPGCSFYHKFLLEEKA